MSYGTNAPFGLQPRYMLTGATWNDQTSEYLIQSEYSTSLFTGDPVTWDATGTIQIATGGTAGSQGATLGVFMGCQYLLNNTFVYSPYWPAGTAVDNNGYATAFVVDDPNVLFDIQVASSANFAAPVIDQIDMGLNANFAIGGTGNPASGSIITGQSAYYLNYETLTPGTSATLNLKLIRFTPNPTNLQVPSNPTPAFNNALVLINNHVYKGGTGTAGV